MTKRKLSAENRQGRKQRICEIPEPSNQDLSEMYALLDLDTADVERDELGAQLECMRLKKEAAEESANGAVKRIVELRADLALTQAAFTAARDTAIQMEEERDAAQATVEQQGVIAAMLPLAKFGLKALEYTRTDATNRSLCSECGEFSYHAEEDHLRQMAEEFGLCQMTKNFDDGKLISYTIVFPNQPDSLDNHAQLAADHDTRIRADERKRVLEEAKELVISMIDPKICGRRTAVEESLIYAISTRLRALAAQPEEVK